MTNEKTITIEQAQEHVTQFGYYLPSAATEFHTKSQYSTINLSLPIKKHGKITWLVLVLPHQ